MPLLIITAAEIQMATAQAHAPRSPFAVRLLFAQNSAAPSITACAAPSTDKNARTVMRMDYTPSYPSRMRWFLFLAALVLAHGPAIAQDPSRELWRALDSGSADRVRAALQQG